jgi:hypothetical protein
MSLLLRHERIKRRTTIGADVTFISSVKINIGFKRKRGTQARTVWIKIFAKSSGSRFEDTISRTSFGDTMQEDIIAVSGAAVELQALLLR